MPDKPVSPSRYGTIDAVIELSASLELLFTEPPEHTFDERIDRASDAGLRAIEIWRWRNKDLPAISKALTQTGVELASMIVEPMLPIVDPAVRADALKAIADSAPVAADLGCSTLVITVGDARPGVPRRDQHEAIVETLKAAAPIVEPHGVTLALENLNSRVDHVGHYLDSAIETLDIVDEVGSPHVQMLYDLYHSVVMGESPREVLDGRLDRVRHVQIADTPGRHEPGTGTIDWPAELGWLASNGYRGRIGLEYMPTIDTVESLKLIRSVVAGL
jgi:hydroxypyruvate isomerase